MRLIILYKLIGVNINFKNKLNIVTIETFHIFPLLIYRKFITELIKIFIYNIRGKI